MGSSESRAEVSVSSTRQPFVVAAAGDHCIWGFVELSESQQEPDLDSLRVVPVSSTCRFAVVACSARIIDFPLTMESFPIARKQHCWR